MGKTLASPPRVSPMLRLRCYAVRELERISRREVFIDEALSTARANADVAPESLKMLEFWIKGVVEHRGSLDVEIVEAAGRPLDGFDAQVLELLRLALFQLRFQENAHTGGVVSESVDACKLLRLERASGFVNAVLRRLSAKPVEKQSPQTATADVPAWLLSRLTRQYGEEANSILQASGQPPPLTLRVNTKRCDLAELRRSLEAESLSVEPAEISAHTLRVINLPKNVRISELTAFKEGLFFIQDESSAIVAELLDPEPGMTVVDLCSAPGGKACAAAMLMKDQGLVLAFDKAAKRLERVQENVQRLGLQSVKSVAADALYPPITGVFERVLLDAPCSGIGTLARKADIRWNRHNDQFAGLAEMQLKMLAVAFGLLAPAGKLVYSTCSIDSEENEAVVNKFLQQQPGCVVAGLPDWLPQAARSACGRFFASLPHRFKMTGAFGAVLARSK